jgi:predicted nicotinamide N-methyase
MLLLPGPAFSIDWTGKSEKSFLIANQIVKLNSSPLKLDNHAVDTCTNVWDGSIVLAKYLEENSASVSSLDFLNFPSPSSTNITGNSIRKSRFPLDGKNVLELGSGLGLVSIAASLLGAIVTLSDHKDAIAQLPNIPNISIASLDWLEPQKSTVITNKFDLIVGADIVWLMELVQPLINTLILLMPLGSTTKFLLAYQERSSAVTRAFFSGLVHAFFAWELISPEDCQGEWRKDNIQLYEIRRVQQCTYAKD